MNYNSPHSWRYLGGLEGKEALQTTAVQFLMAQLPKLGAFSHFKRCLTRLAIYHPYSPPITDVVKKKYLGLIVSSDRDYPHLSLLEPRLIQSTYLLPYSPLFPSHCAWTTSVRV